MNMTEHKLFHIFIRPKDEPKFGVSAEVFDFRFVAETPVEALTKLMAIPDIDYMYDKDNYEIVIQYDGVVY